MTAPSLALTLLPGRYAVAQLPAGAALPDPADTLASLDKEYAFNQEWLAG